MNLTIPQRFDVVSTSHTVYAPLSHGCPSMTIAVDRAAFKKTAEEKHKLYVLKKELVKTKNHKFETILKAAF